MSLAGQAGRVGYLAYVLLSDTVLALGLSWMAMGWEKSRSIGASAVESWQMPKRTATCRGHNDWWLFLKSAMLPRTVCNDGVWSRR